MNFHVKGVYMKEEDFKKYLSDRYTDQIKWYSNKASKNKKYYQCFQWLAIILSSIVPVLIIVVPEKYQLYTVAISVLLSISTSGLKTFKFQETWINYRTISETLKKEKYFYDAELDNYSECNDRNAVFVERVEALISRENSMWIMTHTKKEKDTEEGC